MLPPLTQQQLEDILECGIREFAEHGLKGANMKTIAADADVSVGVLYRYYTGKEELFKSCFDWSYKQLSATIAGSVATADSVESLVGNLLDAITGYAQEHSSYFLLYFRLATLEAEEAEAYAETLESVSAQTYTAFTKQAQEAGLIRKDINAEMIAYIFDNLIAMYQKSVAVPFYKKRAQVYIGDTPYEEVKRQMVAFISSALRP